MYLTPNQEFLGLNHIIASFGAHYPVLFVSNSIMMIFQNENLSPCDHGDGHKHSC